MDNRLQQSCSLCRKNFVLKCFRTKNYQKMKIPKIGAIQTWKIPPTRDPLLLIKNYFLSVVAWLTREMYAIELEVICMFGSKMFWNRKISKTNSLSVAASRSSLPAASAPPFPRLLAARCSCSAVSTAPAALCQLLLLCRFHGSKSRSGWTFGFARFNDCVLASK